MKTSLIFGGLLALLTGFAITVQATLTSRTGAIIGDLQTGLLTSVLGGSLGLVVALSWYLIRPESWRLTGTAVVMLAVAGSLGLFIISGISFSLQRVGVAAGLAGLIFGQLMLSIVIDTRGMGGVEPIPLTLPRILGLAAMAVGVYLLLPKT